jgi:Mn-dependent DtxR family transcriptional regulator
MKCLLVLKKPRHACSAHVRRRVPPASLKELAAELRVGESRVSQISRRACEKIREAFDAGELIGLTAEGEAEAERLLAQRKRKAA